MSSHLDDMPEETEAQQAPEESAEDSVRSQRWRLIRDLLVFVVKASLEAVRDIALIPAALIAGFAGLVFSPSKPDAYFQRVLEVGDEFDEFVDLFGKEKRRRSGSRFDPAEEAELGEDRYRIDEFFERIEKVMIEEVKRGGVTAQAKAAIDHGLDAIHDAVGSTSSPRSRAAPVAKPVKG